MRSIKEMTGVKSVKGVYGVEIEVEGTKLPRNIDMYWRVERDGSLKSAEAFEYVMSKPSDIDGVKTALDLLDKTFTDNSSTVDESIRAGVHVHMNVQDWDIVQLMTFSTAYYILEDILLNWCGPNREGNLFCLRTGDAEYVLFKLYDALISKDLRKLNDDIIRYASLNYCSLFKYGSVEFRGMRSTRDLNTIFDWVKVIDDLRESSMKFSSPVDIMAMMSGEGGEGFFKFMLPNTHHLFNTDGIENKIIQAARRIQMIVYCTEWSKLDEKKINIFDNSGGF